MTKGKIFRSLLLLIFVCLSLFPVLVLLNTSLQTYEQIIAWPPSWFENLQFGNYAQVLGGEKSILPAFLNSLIVAFCTMLICLLVGILAAYALTRYRFVGKGGFLLMVVATQMFSSVILVNAMYVIFRRLGLLDSLFALVVANTATALPLTVFLLFSYFSQVPLTYEEAAWMDGSSRWQAIWHILLPMCLPGIVTAALFAFITAWGDLVYAKTLVVAPELRTLPLALTDFRDLYKTSWETQMAASVVTTLPPFLIFLVIQKHLVRGMSQQGLKS